MQGSIVQLTWFHWHFNNMDSHDCLQELLESLYAALHMEVRCYCCKIQWALSFLS